MASRRLAYLHDHRPRGGGWRGGGGVNMHACVLWVRECLVHRELPAWLYACLVQVHWGPVWHVPNTSTLSPPMDATSSGCSGWVLGGMIRRVVQRRGASLTGMTSRVLQHQYWAPWPSTCPAVSRDQDMQSGGCRVGAPRAHLSTKRRLQGDTCKAPSPPAVCDGGAWGPHTPGAT